MEGDIPLELTLQMGRYVEMSPCYVYPDAKPVFRPLKQVPGEVRGTLQRADHLLSIAAKSLRDIPLTDTDKPGLRRYIKRIPLGVALVVAPWKYGSFSDEFLAANLTPSCSLSHRSPATHTSSWSIQSSQHSLRGIRSSSNPLPRLPFLLNVSRSPFTTPAYPGTRYRSST